MDEAAPADLDFSGLYRVDYPGMGRLAVSLLRDVDQAEDVVQDAFARLHWRFLSLGRPGGYLRTGVVNLCRNGHRRGPLEKRNAVPVLRYWLIGPRWTSLRRWAPGALDRNKRPGRLPTRCVEERVGEDEGSLVLDPDDAVGRNGDGHAHAVTVARDLWDPLDRGRQAVGRPGRPGVGRAGDTRSRDPAGLGRRAPDALLPPVRQHHGGPGAPAVHRVENRRPAGQQSAVAGDRTVHRGHEVLGPRDDVFAPGAATVGGAPRLERRL